MSDIIDSAMKPVEEAMKLIIDDRNKLLGENKQYKNLVSEIEKLKGSELYNLLMSVSNIKQIIQKYKESK